MPHNYHLSRVKKKKKILLIDTLAYISGIISPLMALPQAYDVWILKNVAGVSLLSWGSFAFFNVIFITYGVINKEKLILITSGMGLLFQSIIVMGILMNH